jgi:hypothetical protein
VPSLRDSEGYGQLFGVAGCADLAEDILLDGLVAFVDDVHESHAILAAVGEDVGDLEIAEGGDEFPASAVELPDLELLEAIQNSCQLSVSVVSC